MGTAVKKPRITLAPPAKKSSSISSHGYCPATLTLGVTFGTDPTVHHYGEFTPKKWADMQAADSLGNFFATKVRGHHPHSVPSGAED